MANGDPAPTVPPRPSAGFTARGLGSILLGYKAAFLIFCGGYGVYVLVTGFTGHEFTPGEVDPGLYRVVSVLAALAALAIAAGYIGAVAAARRHNLSRGEAGARPRLNWRIALSPRGLSRWLFTPRGVYEIDDVLISRLGLARSLAGVAVFAVAVLYYQPTAVLDYGEQLFIQTSNAIVLATVVLAVCAVVVLATVEAGQRRRAARALSRPLLAALPAAGALGVLLAASIISVKPPADVPVSDLRSGDGAAIELVWALMWTPITAPHHMWSLVFLGCGVYYLSRYMFNSADAHPLLAPIATMAVTWTLTVVSLLGTVGVVSRLPVADVPLPIPTGLATLLSLAGTATVTALAVWEMVRLRRLGLRLRSGPWR